MAANGKFESISGTPEDSGFTGSFPNTQRGSHAAATSSLDRIGSFRDNSDARASGLGNSSFRGTAGDLPPLSQLLILDQVTLGDLKHTRSGELRRALGLFSGTIHEDSSFVTAHSKLSPTMATDEVRRIRSSLLDSTVKARNRVKRWGESLNKLNNFLEVTSRKQQKNERLSSSNLLKGGVQSQKKSPDLMTQKFDDRAKNLLSRRARTPIGDMRPEGRASGIPRPHVMLGKEKDMVKEAGLSSDPVEEKIRRLPVGGESWDRKMKRKRSVSNGFPRPVDSDIDTKRNMHVRVSNESGSPFSDGHAFRSGSANSVSNISKPNGASSGVGSSDCPTPKSELEKASFSRELAGMNKERTSQKGSNKLNVCEESHLVSPNLMTKGKASRASRNGPSLTGGSSPKFSRISGIPDDWEQCQNVGKIHPLGGINDRKRALPSESSSPPMAQWVGQRPQKISRTRRTNIISPTSNNDETLPASEGCSISEVGTRGTSGGNGPFPGRSMANNPQPLKIKRENAPSPAQLGEGEETNVVENRVQGSVVDVQEKAVNGYYRAGSPGLLTKKSKPTAKEETGDGVRRQGRSGRGSSFSRGNVSLLGEKLDTPPASKPARNTRPGSEKNCSKSGRPPLKKHSERKGFTRLGLIPNGNSPDCTGESDDDREELLQAAQLACKSSYNACSSDFFKKMEPLFSLQSGDKSFLTQQLKTSEEHQQSLSQTCDVDGKENMSDFLRDKVQQPQRFGMESAKSEDLVIQDHDSSDFLYRNGSGNGYTNVTPLYQRVLSALIVDDESEGFEESTGGAHTSLWSCTDNHGPTESNLFCNGDNHYSRYSSIQNPSRDDVLTGDYDFRHSKPGMPCTPSQNNMNGSLIPMNMPTDIFSGDQYAQMPIDDKVLIELQSIGLYPESVPDLAEGEVEDFNKDFLELKNQLSLQAGKKKTCLERLQKVVEGKTQAEERALEQVAMSKLIELSYKKLLATRGSIAARLGVSKVSRQVALAFVRRTLARCRKLEDTGKSCFAEPALWDVLVAGPPACNDPKNSSCNSLRDQNSQREARVSGSQSAASGHLGLQRDISERGLLDSYDPVPNQNGPILNRGKRKEVLLDDVSNTAALTSQSPLGGAIVGGGAKGKRSERDREKDQLCRNPGPKSGRPSITNLLGERKAKSKPKQKAAAQTSTTYPVFPAATHSAELAAKGSNNVKKEGLASPNNDVGSSKESKDPADVPNLPLHDIDPIEELGVGGDFGEHQDLGSWLNFEEDNLLDHDSMGLEIPMDDLSELNMLL